MYIVLFTEEIRLHLAAICSDIMQTDLQQQQMKLFSINCQSWKTAKSGFSDVVDSYGIDVLCLTETFESAREPVTFRKWSKISKSRKDGYGGVAILYKDDENGVIIERKKELELDTVEVICSKVKTNKNNTFMLVVEYLPPERKEQLEGLLLVVLDKCRKDYKHIILTEDLNSKSIEWNNKKSNVCGNLLEDYLHRSGLICVNDGKPVFTNTFQTLPDIRSGAVMNITRPNKILQDR